MLQPSYNAKVRTSLSSAGKTIAPANARRRSQGDFSVPARIFFNIDRPTTTPVSVQNVEREFRRHANKWRRETLHLSSPIDRYLHPSYARIIGLIASYGDVGLRIILQDLHDNQNDWFYALRSITGANPVTSSMAGDVPRMVNAWIKWGVERGIIDGHTP